MNTLKTRLTCAILGASSGLYIWGLNLPAAGRTAGPWNEQPLTVACWVMMALVDERMR
jgi:hypothetical protein